MNPRPLHLASAALLASLDCDFTIHHPPELRTALNHLANRLHHLAEEPLAESPPEWGI